MKKRRRRSRHRFESIPNVPANLSGRFLHALRANGDSNTSKDVPSSSNPPTLGMSAQLSIPSEFDVRQESTSDLSALIRRTSLESCDPPLSISFPGVMVSMETQDTANEYNRAAVYLSNNETEHFESPIVNWRVLWALLRTCGSLRLTKEQYQSVRLFAQALIQDGSRDWKEEASLTARSMSMVLKTSYLPHYSTLYKSVKPVLFQKIAVRSFIHQESVDLGKAGALSRQTSTSGDPVISVRTVLPSEYARADLATPHVFDAIRRTSLQFHKKNGLSSAIPSISTIDCIDLVPLIAAREWFYGYPRSIFVDSYEPNVSPSVTAEARDILRISLMTTDTDLPDEAFQRFFGLDSQPGVNQQVKGKVVHVWIVSHEKRKFTYEAEESVSQSLSPRDRDIVSLFNFLTYTSPSDSVSVIVPDIPDCVEGDYQNVEDDSVAALRRKENLKRLKRLRKAALDRRRLEMEQARRSWEKPIVKPGDTVAILSPCVGETDTNTLLTNADMRSRVLLLSRFWTEMEERSTHILWVPGGVDTDMQSNGQKKFATDLTPYCRRPFVNSPQYYRYVRDVILVQQKDEKTGPQPFSPVSSLGMLDTGELYCVYRFLIFWDGFEVQDGKEASGDGIYMLCLNLPAISNRTPNDVRIISPTTPGVKSDTVLRMLLQDIVEGMTKGFADIDAHGQKRRIFLDLVGFIGDTPTLNAFLDDMGHNACACCHICRYVRQSSALVGSRFTGRTTQGSRTAVQRGFYQHQAVRDCSPGKETCRLMGLKANPDGSNLALHHLSSAMLDVRHLVPKTSNGVSVVPCVLDPYKACLIAPDHLLTGHVRGCINLALKMLPTTKDSEIFEGAMLEMLQKCELSTQNRLVNHDKKKLHGMTMSELYALSFVAPYAFSNACAISTHRTGSGEM